MNETYRFESDSSFLQAISYACEETCPANP
jgi:hypothetical protein